MKKYSRRGFLKASTFSALSVAIPLPTKLSAQVAEVEVSAPSEKTAAKADYEWAVNLAKKSYSDGAYESFVDLMQPYVDGEKSIIGSPITRNKIQRIKRQKHIRDFPENLYRYDDLYEKALLQSQRILMRSDSLSSYRYDNNLKKSAFPFTRPEVRI